MSWAVVHWRRDGATVTGWRLLDVYVFADEQTADAFVDEQSERRDDADGYHIRPVSEAFSNV